jgi:hypothetical protein
MGWEGMDMAEVALGNEWINRVERNGEAELRIVLEE